MKVVGLIAEYNPFHNGHAYHIKKAKEITGADKVLVVMSGNYVQRGAPAIMPKHLRAKCALEAGASVVLELPVAYAAGSAEYFASGAVSLLERTGCTDALCFGSECGDSRLLKKTARIAADEPTEYRMILREALRTGMSFPLARQTALKSCLKNDTLNQILEQPNNILGIEYLKALYKTNSSIKAYTVRRISSGYHDKELAEYYSSASAIRKVIASTDDLSGLRNQMPSFCIRYLETAYQNRYPVFTDDFSLLLKHRLLYENTDSLMRYMDVTEELAGRIMNHLNEFISFEQFVRKIKTKDMTYARISRCLMHILLQITAADMKEYEAAGGCQYAHLLGFRKDSTELLTQIKEHTQIPLLSRLTRTERLSPVALKQLGQDIFASNLYESIVTDKYQTPFINEYQQQIIRI